MNFMRWLRLVLRLSILFKCGTRASQPPTDAHEIMDWHRKAHREQQIQEALHLAEASLQTYTRTLQRRRESHATHTGEYPQEPGTYRLERMVHLFRVLVALNKGRRDAFYKGQDDVNKGILFLARILPNEHTILQQRKDDLDHIHDQPTQYGDHATDEQIKRELYETDFQVWDRLNHEMLSLEAMSPVPPFALSR